MYWYAEPSMSEHNSWMSQVRIVITEGPWYWVDIHNDPYWQMVVQTYKHTDGQTETCQVIAVILQLYFAVRAN